ncbi:hypothetical protein QN277_017676 [Acacia crassicarpa]|uniref:Uncharacterized protein n=1 Tax=Acacia crassicarpa TaxID=499986 RepID=A0AAE1MQR9_9FABA|nr:hypothetical protein QN277_017676 [Acacia crassicarpa]
MQRCGSVMLAVTGRVSCDGSVDRKSVNHWAVPWPVPLLTPLLPVRLVCVASGDWYDFVGRLQPKLTGEK